MDQPLADYELLRHWGLRGIDPLGKPGREYNEERPKVSGWMSHLDKVRALERQVWDYKSVLRYFSPESQARVTTVWPRASP